MSALPAVENWTVDELPDDPWPRYEIFDGSLHVSPVPTSQHQVAATLLAQALNQGASADLLAVCGLGILRTWESGRQRFLVPDVTVVERVALGGLAVAPKGVHLVVEFASPSTELVDRTVKARMFAELAIPHYWLLTPSGARISFDREDNFQADPEWMLAARETFLSSLG